MILHPVAFADFEAFLTGIGLDDFGGPTRDCYAADMAAVGKARRR